MRAALALAALLALTGAAEAAEPNSFDGWTCDQVRTYVEMHGRMVALVVAKAKGATKAQIVAAKRCLEEKR